MTRSHDKGVSNATNPSARDPRRRARRGAAVAFALGPAVPRTPHRPRRAARTARTPRSRLCSSACRPPAPSSTSTALQAIADANGGTRAAGTPGYEASVDYVVDTLEAAGWDVSIDEFPFTYVGPSTLQQLTPVNATYPTGPFTGSGPGDVTAAVTPVDLQLGLGNTSTSGCEAADFAGFPAGNIALVQRGTCDFADKAVNAEAAGAAGVIIFNQGNTAAADRQELIVGTLGGSDVVGIPVVGASYAAGRRARAGRVDGAGLRARARAASAEERHRRAARASTTTTS